MTKLAKVILPLPVEGMYDYYVPAGMDIHEGDMVVVPFGKRESIGVVRHIQKDPEERKTKFRIREIRARHGEWKLPPISLRFADWVASYTLTPPGMIMKMIMGSQNISVTPIQHKQGYKTRQGSDLPEALKDPYLDQPRLSAEIMRFTGATRYRIEKWIKEGFLVPVPMQDGLYPEPDPDYICAPLSAHQEEAVSHLINRMETGDFSVTLLDGVTGSGKTAVYLEALAWCLRQGKQILILVPEIALGPQTVNRFRERFGAAPAVWHSDIPANQRQRIWQDVCQGKTRVIAGARSALFLPFSDLGLIIVDEEHEQSYKQEEGVIYQARDMAVVRASLGKIPIILASATPSLETVVNSRQGRYGTVQLPIRFGAAEMPHLELVDLRKKENMAPGMRWISAPLCSAIESALSRNEQTLLFLNRRGYAPLTLCRACGHRIQCIRCSAWLVEHRHHGELRCHQCGYTTPKPQECPVCASPELVPCGPGVERLQEEVLHRFPDARLLVMASDTIQSPSHLAGCLEKIRNQETDIIIGTQMMARGHDFAHLTQVGVIDADLGLSGGDLRACEKTYQLLHQVSGRAGRSEKPGHVLLQTYQPEHPVIQAMLSGERERFLEEESRLRQENGMPPFSRLAALILSSTDAVAAEKTARLLAQNAPRGNGFEVMGPVPAPISIVRGRYRWRLLLRTHREKQPQSYLKEWISKVRIPSCVRLYIDVDPYSFL